MEPILASRDFVHRILFVTATPTAGLDFCVARRPAPPLGGLFLAMLGRNVVTVIMNVLGVHLIVVTVPVLVKGVQFQLVQVVVHRVGGNACSLSLMVALVTKTHRAISVPSARTVSA